MAEAPQGIYEVLVAESREPVPRLPKELHAGNATLPGPSVKEVQGEGIDEP